MWLWKKLGSYSTASDLNIELTVSSCLSEDRALFRMPVHLSVSITTLSAPSHFPLTGALICFLVWFALYFYSLPCLLECSKPDGSVSLQSLGFPISMNQAKFAFSLLPIFPALKFSLLIHTDLSLPCLLRGFTPQAIMLPEIPAQPTSSVMSVQCHRFSRPYDSPHLSHSSLSHFPAFC